MQYLFIIIFISSLLGKVNGKTNNIMSIKTNGNVVDENKHQCDNSIEIKKRVYEWIEKTKVFKWLEKKGLFEILDEKEYNEYVIRLIEV